jgi:hypothetical protein
MGLADGIEDAIRATSAHPGGRESPISTAISGGHPTADRHMGGHPARYPLRICSLMMSACPQC